MIPSLLIYRNLVAEGSKFAEVGSKSVEGGSKFAEWGSKASESPGGK